MDIANEIAQYLDDAGFGTLGTDIFVGQIPAEQNGLYVLRAGGQAKLYNPLEEAILDIYCKNTKALTCVSTLEDIKRFIHRMHNTTTTNAYVYSILLIGDVEDIARDLEYSKVYKITISVLSRDTGVIS